MIDQAAPLVSPLAIFDDLERGVRAPAWVEEGIRRSWALPANAEASLISISENATFRVVANGATRMVVRLQRPGYVGDIANVRSELDWIEAIALDTDVRTPLPVRGSDGAPIQTIAGPRATAWTAVAFEFVRGRMLEDLPDQPSHFARIGAMAAQLHQHSRSWRRPDGFRRFDWTLEDMIGASARWGSWERAALTDGERETLRRAADAARAVLATHPVTPGNWGLIHSDIRPSNIMIDGSELVVIDFDDSGFSYYLYDFASALTFYEHLPQAIPMAGNWLEGYRSVLPLSAAELDAAAALSLVRRLTMLGWATTHREDALPAELWQGNLPGTIDVARRYLERPLWLVDPA